MFSRIGRCGSSASMRSAGTSTTPVRIASYGWRGLNGSPRTSISPLGGLRSPARESNSRSWPWPSSAATPRISPARSSNETPSGSSPTTRLRTSSCVSPGLAVDLDGGASRPRRSRTRSPGRAWCATRPASARRSSPPRPACGTSVPTVRPSRRTLARSHSALTSARRWEMNSTDRPRSRHSRMTVKTFSARSDGSAAVISSSMQQLRVAREGAREVEHAQRRQRQVAGHLGEVDLRAPCARATRARPRSGCA